MLRHSAIVVTTLLCLAAQNAPAADVDFAKQIQPIFMKHCAGCHGEKKKLGKLRLHTVAAIQEKAAADDHFLLAGKPLESELYERLVLPADHKKRMPKKADPLPKEKTELIRLWIEQGATFAAATGTSQPAPEEQPQTKPQAELPLPEVKPADATAIQGVTAAGAQVNVLYADSPLLSINYALNSEPANDAQAAPLTNMAEQVYSLNLAGSKVTDAGMGVLSQLKNLSTLHLENSAATDAGLAHIASLERLQYINVYGTAITDAGLVHLEGMKHLRKLYVWKTKVSYDAAMALQKKIPGLQVVLGFDHPVVKRIRLTKELKRAEEQAKLTTEEEKKLKVEFDKATKAKQTAAERVQQIQKDLKALEGGT
jgi:mono/diheme cytochrome c family protein